MKKLKFYGDQLIIGENAINHLSTLNYEKVFM